MRLDMPSAVQQLPSTAKTQAGAPVPHDSLKVQLFWNRFNSCHADKQGSAKKFFTTGRGAGREWEAGQRPTKERQLGVRTGGQDWSMRL